MLIYEIFSRGNKPFADVPNRQILQVIQKGRRPPQPMLAEDSVYAVMQRCWALDPKQRPTFPELSQALRDCDASDA